MNYSVEERGYINLNNKVMVSDPCYRLGTWCQGVLENVLPGKYLCKVGFSDEGDWGVRVAEIEVRHIDYKDEYLFAEPEDFEVGVDSGQAGIYDYEYYEKYHTDSKEWPHVDQDWYDKACNLTYTKERNPNYKEFKWKPLENMSLDETLEEIERHRKYLEDWESNSLYLEKLDANTIDGLGFVSSSGYGDGGYTCYTAKNDDGKIVSILIEYLNEDDECED